MVTLCGRRRRMKENGQFSIRKRKNLLKYCLRECNQRHFPITKRIEPSALNQAHYYQAHLPTTLAPKAYTCFIYNILQLSKKEPTDMNNTASPYRMIL